MGIPIYVINYMAEPLSMILRYVMLYDNIVLYVNFTWLLRKQTPQPILLDDRREGLFGFLVAAAVILYQIDPIF